VLGIADAGHVESDPDTVRPLIVQVACAVPDRDTAAPLLSGRLRIDLEPGSLLYAALKQPFIMEEFTCNYELNPSFQAAFEAAGMAVSGRGEAGDARAVELRGHPFFVATLFQPQLSSSPAAPHPLVLAFLDAALRGRRTRLVPDSEPDSAGRGLATA
jgi:CTP synthase (UTP-ammonia lyase)